MALCAMPLLRAAYLLGCAHGRAEIAVPCGFWRSIAAGYHDYHGREYLLVDASLVLDCNVL